MPVRLPSEVHSLLTAASQADRDTAWESFVASHSRLMLFAARSVTHDADDAMDAYAWTLERLRENESHRLRGFSEAQGTLFSTWLVVVVRRICLDFVRHRRGRPSKASPAPSPEQHDMRRRLVDLLGEPAALEHVRDNRRDAEAMLEASQLHEALQRALDGLPAADRLLLALRFDDGLSASEIARTMRFPTQFHVYRRLNTVLAALRRRLRAGGVDGPDG